MSYYIITLAANKPVNMTVAGNVILIDDLGAAPGLDITPSYGGRDLPKMPNRKKAFKFMEAFDAVTLAAPVDCTVALFLSKNDVSLGFADGSLVNVSGQVIVSNTAAARVPVDIGGGTVNVTAGNVTIGNDSAHAVPTMALLASVVTNLNPVAVNDAGVAVVAADATRRGLRIRNAGASPVAIGGVGVAYTSATDLIQPGETWNEVEAPGSAWYAVCAAGMASTVNISRIA